MGDMGDRDETTGASDELFAGAEERDAGGDNMDNDEDLDR